ncbi:MAG: single-stranded DNA-binding protein [Actinobacteria bacterium]|nr:single-stranded DNA-binding protein [Actinomycetota bacterium]
MANINQTYILGNLTRDPELKYTNEGIAIAEMGIAVDKKWRDSNGEENNSVDYFNITAWNNLAENCASSLKKGDRIILAGHLNLRSWENKEGKKFNIVNITADIVAISLEFVEKNKGLEYFPFQENPSAEKPSARFKKKATQPGNKHEEFAGQSTG